jgi:hypothetical protein
MEAIGGFTADRALRPGAGGLASVSGNDGGGPLSGVVIDGGTSVGRLPDGDGAGLRGVSPESVANNVVPPHQNGSMEAAGGFTADRALRPGAALASVGANALQSVPVYGGASVLEGDVVDQALAVLEPDSITAEDTALWGFRQAADFAGRVE